MNNQRARRSPRLLALAVSGIARGSARVPALTWLAGVLLTMLLALLALPAMAAPAPLVLDDAHPQVEAWPAVTVLRDPAGTLVADALLGAPERFAMPQGAYATLGMQDGVSWLRVPAMVAAGNDGAWVLKIDFGLLKQVEIFLARDGRIVQHGMAGSGLAPRGALGGPVPAFIVHLEPGVRYEVLLRVESISAMILPVSFEKPAAFHATAMNEQLLQGALAGLTLCLLLYSLAQWISLRDTLFAKYSLLVGGLALHNFAWFGYGSEYLWGGSAWAVTHMPGVVALLTSCGAYLFVEQALARPRLDRLLSRLMKAGPLLCLASVVVWSFDLIDTRAVTDIIITLGSLPMLLGLPGAFARARRGDTVGMYFLVGWAVSFACAALQGQTCTGVLGADYWSMHAVQFGSTFDMLLFMRILGLRSQDARGAGSRFSFTAGLGLDEAPAEAPGRGPLAGMRLLVVDDSTSAREAMVGMLERFGVKADAVASGEAALACLALADGATQPYHAVLVDYLMPGMDGVETILRMRADRRLGAPPAILMASACSRDGVLARQGESPLSGFLTKPIGPAPLYETLLEVLRPDLARALHDIEYEAALRQLAALAHSIDDDAMEAQA